jgi:pyridoxine 5-phosphate synthase
MKLNVNIDHIATIRNARGGREPEPVAAALICELAGATGIVCHLREDRRHVNDRDVRLLRELIQTKLDLEMAANEEIIKIALVTLPELVTIVPEKRQELTTEGGLNVVANIEKYKKLCDRMHEKNIEVSFFIEPSEEQINAALICGADMVEIHTGVYANAKNELERAGELNIISKAVDLAFSSGLKIAAGHGLNYFNVQPYCKMHKIGELSIGHSIIARSAFVGLDRAVREMLDLMNK